MRESWTDERLDEFRGRVDERFDRVEERLGRLETGLESLNRTIMLGVIALCSAILAGFGGIVTQL